MSWKKIIKNENSSTIKKKLIEAKEIAIFSHIHPDGDAIGAQLGLGQSLEKMGKNVYYYNNSDIPQSFNFIPGFEKLKLFNPEVDHLSPVVIAVDCGNINRLGFSEGTLMNPITVSIDHHQDNDLFAQINLVLPDASATCEIIGILLKEWGWPMDQGIATALFTGLSTDTGSFKYNQTSADTFSLASWLMQQGSDHNAIRLKLYESMTKGKFELLKQIYNKTSFQCDDKLATVTITDQDLKTFQVADDEVHGIVSLLKEVEGVEVSVLFRTLEEGKVKISFRSKEWLDVSKIAQHFGGGGHARAAGATIAGNLDLIRNNVLFEICQQVREKENE